MPWSLNRATQHLPRFLQRKRVYPPLLDRNTITTLQQLAQHSLSTALDVDLDIHQRLLGEKHSPYVQQGYEFAEIRPYQTGDSVRFINWRRYANTGQLYINRFIEERRPQCWIVMDRRNTMRFGTHVRLKVTQAAMLALYYIYKSHYHQLAVGGVMLGERNRWLDARSSSLDLQTLQKHIIAPAPPLPGETAESSLDAVLRQLLVRCQPGCLIFVVSDFHDLQANSMATLSALSAQHVVSALHVVDPVETSLPRTGKFDLVSDSTTTIRRIDCNNVTVREAFNTKMQHSLASIETLLTQHALHYRRVVADENLLASLR